ncbi:MAG TPA: ABC transporter substrate-binding protein, partial [Nitrososphaerales archaeon]|nr:ABC transporter substrate-binding protein [Nitrososphaerales archaeon]
MIDDANWPEDDLNQLYAVSSLPWPNWLEDTVYQPLIGVNQTSEYGTGVIQYEPALANNWTVSSNGSQYTFNLKQGVTFSNGDPFNAYQVWLEMYGFYYLTANASAWLESYALFNMTNVNFGPATIALINQSGGVINPTQSALSMMENSSWPIYVTGPYSIVFQLESPFSYFPGTLVAYEGLMFDTQYVLDNGGFGTPTQ